MRPFFTLQKNDKKYFFNQCSTGFAKKQEKGQKSRGIRSLGRLVALSAGRESRPKK
jgi:diacylglycerol kinase family enzyme